MVLLVIFVNIIIGHIVNTKIKRVMVIITEEEKLLKGNKYFNIAWKVSFDA